VEGISDLESGSVGALCVERVLGSLWSPRRESWELEGATWGVRDQAIRPAQSRQRSAWV